MINNTSASSLSQSGSSRLDRLVARGELLCPAAQATSPDQHLALMHDSVGLILLAVELLV
jgi:hypothetical protein